MKIAVLGTGMVGQAHAAKLDQLGHEVVVGTRDVPASLGRMEAGQMTGAFGVWAKKHKKVKVATFSDAAASSQLVINSLNGNASLQVLKSLREELANKVLVDISNPLDFSTGELRLTVSNDDSVGEQIQAALPKTKVVKAFNTVNATVQVNAKSLSGGDHHLFIAGDDKKAKAVVIKLAKGYGWKNIIDLGGIKSSRGTEMLMPIWMNLYSVLGTAQFNYKITK